MTSRGKKGKKESNPRTTTKGRAIAQSGMPMQHEDRGSGTLAMSAPALSVSAFVLSMSHV